MEAINLSDFAKAIEKHYSSATPGIAEGYARIWLSKIDPSLYPALQCWIDGKPVPNEKRGNVSVQGIMSIRREDEMSALLYLSEYIRNPEAGMAKIMSLRC